MANWPRWVIKWSRFMPDMERSQTKAPAMSTPTTVTVIHRMEAQCFEAMVDGLRCFADYQRSGDIIRMTHTVVPPALEGRGIAAQLVHEALSWAQSQNLKVDPVCSYVRVYMKRHPQWQSLQA